jgi:DNA-binding beta-propeller fold protein YncE
MVDSDKKLLTADIVVPGRTRWTVFDEKSNRFYVNISKPSQIIAVESVDPDGIAARFDIPATGPHGLDIDREGSRLFCATDDASLFTIDIHSGKVVRAADLTGPPDVIFYNSHLKHLYVAVGDPGVIDVFDTVSMKRVETVKTERGAHTIGYTREQNKVYAFLPETHRAAVFVDK